MKKILSFIFWVFVIIIIIGVVELKKESWDNFKEEPLKENLTKVLEELNMETSKVAGISEISEWNNGPIYEMRYQGEGTYLVYAYEDGQVVSIKKHTEHGGEDIYRNDNIEINNPNEGAITLKYGELGDYGKYVTFDGKEYIRYVFPAGTYEVSALVKNSMFFIEKTKIYKNSYGHDETQTVSTNRLAEVGVKETITLQSDEWINLTMGSHISIKEVK